MPSGRRAALVGAGHCSDGFPSEEGGTDRPGKLIESPLHRMAVDDSKALPRKEVIQPQLPLRLPCYDFAPVIDPTFGACLLAVSSATSGVTDSHSVTGGVYKARERIHRRVLTGVY